MVFRLFKYERKYVYKSNLFKFFHLNLLFLINKLVSGISLRTIRIEEKVSWIYERITKVRLRLYELIFYLELVYLNLLVLQLFFILLV